MIAGVTVHKATNEAADVAGTGFSAERRYCGRSPFGHVRQLDALLGHGIERPSACSPTAAQPDVERLAGVRPRGEVGW